MKLDLNIYLTVTNMCTTDQLNPDQDGLDFWWIVITGAELL